MACPFLPMPGEVANISVLYPKYQFAKQVHHNNNVLNAGMQAVFRKAVFRKADIQHSMQVVFYRLMLALQLEKHLYPHLCVTEQKVVVARACAPAT